MEKLIFRAKNWPRLISRKIRYVIFLNEWGRELMSYFQMGSRDEKGWEPLP